MKNAHQEVTALRFILVVIFLSISRSQQQGHHFHKIYKEGVDAYLENRWGDCVAYITSSVELYFEMQTITVSCKESCKPKNPDNLSFKYSGDTENFEFYEHLIKEAFCIVQCKYDKMSSFPEPSSIPQEVEQEFEQRLPYDYLQICYNNLGDIQNAANYAYSFLLHNPKNEVMMSNLQYYLTHQDVEESELKNMEVKPYQDFYSQGEKQYVKKRFKKVVSFMEKSLKSYFHEEEQCRMLCEGPYKPQSSRPEFLLGVADHYLHTLKCKQHCAENLSFFNNIKHKNFLPEMFNYLQFSYFQLNKAEETCRSVANFLMLLPNDDVMIQNKKYYYNKDFCNKKSFIPSKEIIKYIERDAREKKLLKYIEQWNPFTKNNKDLNSNKVKETVYVPPLHVLDWSKDEGIQLQMGDRELNGSLRFVADGFATPEECSNLQELAISASIEGDGYKGRSPHTKNEKFVGLGVSRLNELLEAKAVSKKQAKLFLDLSEKSRIYVEKYFNLKNLYFDFTHLVCRTSLSDTKRDDLSHAIHSDNCVIQSDGSCLKEPPAFTWRDYSAILYLNNDFEGGDFFFSDRSYKAKASVNPRCGRVVGFAADNWHGVNAVLKGQRCCLAMWFTLDPKHDEVARSELHNLIESASRTN